MAQQIINIGTTANDGTGDPLRTAFDKCNDNFTELYAGGGGGGGGIGGNTGSVDNAILRADGTGGSTLQTSGITIADGTSGTLSGTNSGDVTLAGTPDYITIAGQVITRGQVDLATDITGDLPFANLTAATAASKLLGRGSASGSGDFQEISLGSGLSMSGTTLSVSAGGGNVSSSGTPASGQAAEWDSASTIIGVSTTGTGSYVKATSPTLTTPLLGTPTSGTLTNCTGLPLSSGVTGQLPIANGGTGQTTAVAAFDALAPTTTKGDLILHNGTDNVRLAVGGTNGHVLTVDSSTATGVKWAAASGGGSTNVWIPAAQWIPRTTTGCGIDSRELSTNKINTDELLFDPGTAEYAQCMIVMPSNWNAGTVTAKFHWTASTGSGDVVWGLRGRAYANDDALDQAMGTGQTATDTLTATNDLDISPATSAITLGGTAASGNPVIFEMYRDAAAGGDTLGSDARLLGVEITYTAS
jgi:hypothetical protein